MLCLAAFLPTKSVDGTRVIAGSLYVFLDYIPLCLSCFEACLCAVFEAGTHGTGERSVTKP